MKKNLSSRLKCKWSRIANRLYVALQKRSLYKNVLTLSSSKILYYFCVPVHSNLGDQAQMFCWLHLFAEWFPEYKVIPVACEFLTDKTFEEIRKRIKKEDKIFIHSGYLIFDPHPHLPYIRKIVDSFHDFPITILPQTINLCEKNVIKETVKSFSAHPNLTIISRDEVSKSNADHLFPENKRLLMPDVVTSLIGNKEFGYPSVKRNGILFCIRNDGEKFYTDEQIESLRLRFGNVFTDRCDTSINKNMRVWGKYRDRLIRSMLKKFSQYQVIVTDRYHGTIFSQIVNTPVIVLTTTDHKLSSGVSWFPKNVFENKIEYAQNLDEAYEKALAIINRNAITTNNPPYFKNAYYLVPMNF